MILHVRKEAILHDSDKIYDSSIAPGNGRIF